MVALDAVQPVGRLALLSKSAQTRAPQPDEPELELELLELDELLELEDELLDDELELLELELLDDELLELDEELLELDDELVELEPGPPQAARAQEVRMIGINLRMFGVPRLLL